MLLKTSVTCCSISGGGRGEGREEGEGGEEGGRGEGRYLRV